MSEALSPLPCIVCGFQPEPAFRMEEGTHQPYAATMFSAGAGHYGSTVWDEMSRYRSLTLNVCDGCLVARKERVGVFETVPNPDSVKLVPWEPAQPPPDDEPAFSANLPSQAMLDKLRRWREMRGR